MIIIIAHILNAIFSDYKNDTKVLNIFITKLIHWSFTCYLKFKYYIKFLLPSDIFITNIFITNNIKICSYALYENLTVAFCQSYARKSGRLDQIQAWLFSVLALTIAYLTDSFWRSFLGYSILIQYTSFMI